jgi:hypothetical protein
LPEFLTQRHQPFSAINSYFRVAGKPTRIHEFACRPLDECLGDLASTEKMDR